MVAVEAMDLLWEGEEKERFEVRLCRVREVYDVEVFNYLMMSEDIVDGQHFT